VSLRASDYEYVLPEDLIARHPLPQRDAARMLVIDRARGTISHHSFRELRSLLDPAAFLVLNDTRVMPARVFSEDGKIELLLVEARGERTWVSLVKPGRKCSVGRRFAVAGTEAEVKEVLPGGERIIVFEDAPDLERFGQIPLPPYMERAPDAEDAQRYQTVFSRASGAVAAPTAGLHFTPEILSEFPHAFVTLHVGPGTFRPVSAENITEHQMHEERFVIRPEAAQAISRARPLVAVGTTVVRVLESAESDAEGGLVPGEGRTRIFIHPPYQFRRVDALLTNFHLPRSTLLMLVCAFAGRNLVLRAYEEAVRARYRFYSYGDCMLIT
jgi:S-adenosylmethionine:tRNA ribosyltransferase-isomerase